MTAHDAVLGVDGCPGGWVAALVRGHHVRWYAGSFADLLGLPAAVVAVDIPIGLPSGGERRRCDVAARQLLGTQRSSVFFAPPRTALHAPTQAEATVLSRAAGSVGVSIQTFHILAKVAEVDALLAAGADPGGRVVEVHPEVSLHRLAGASTAQEPLPPKRTAAGRRQRLAVLRTWLPRLELPVRRPGRATADDCLDALACAWTAQRWLRGEADVLGDELDATGRPMRIVV